MTRLARFTNNATTRLASGLSAVATTMTITSGEGTKFPTLTGGQYFTATLIKADGTKEIVKVTARSTDTFTIVRAYEAVAGVQTASSFSAGDKVELRLTAAAIGDEMDTLHRAAFDRALNKSANYTVVQADVSSLIRMDSTAGARVVTLPAISTLTDDFSVMVSKISVDANTVSVAASGSDTINGGGSYGLTAQWQSVWLVVDRTTGTWTAVAGSGSGGDYPSASFVVDAFTGSGTAGPFTLSGTPAGKNATMVTVGGVYQQKSTYTLTGNQITLGGPVTAGVPVEVVWNPATATGGTSADIVTYDPLTTYPANSVGAELRTAQSQTEHFWRAVRNNQRDVYIIVTGDSTGNETTEWVYLMAQWLAAQCPTHTIKYRLFNDGSTNWDAYSTLQTGSGPSLPYTVTPFTIFIDNGSVSGTNTFYTQGARESAFWTGNDYDLAFINYGHNLGTAMTEYIALPEWVMCLSHVRSLAPRAGLLVTLQNPRSSSTSDINTNGSAQSARMVAAWRKAVELVGAGVIDVYTAFKTHADYASLMADETHPSSAGQQVWLQEVKRVMAEPVRLTGDAPLGYNPLVEQRPNFAPNPRFSRWTGATPDGWSFSNCTPVKNIGVTDGTLYSMEVQIGAGTNPYISTDITTLLTKFRGKTVSFMARLWLPSGLDLLTGRIAIETTDNTTNPSFTSYPRGTPSNGGWQWVFATLTIQRTPRPTAAQLRIYAGAANGSDSGEKFYIDSVWFGEGLLPAGVGFEDATLKSVLDYYNDANAGLFAGNTGTLTAAGGTLTLTGSPTNNSDTYINLPGLTTGKTYKVTFNCTSSTGNTAGGCYMRNGFDGGSTDLAKASGTGDWVAGTGAVSFTFVAPAGPVSIRPYGYTGTTGYVMTSWTVKPVESGIQVADNLPLQAWKNPAGETLSAAFPTGGFAIIQSVGTSTQLGGESAQANTKTSVTTYEYVVADDYVAGRDLTVTVNAYYTGTGTASTKTLTLAARKITDTSGAHGSDLGPAAQNITNAAADYAFTVNGATLTPGCRLLLRLTMVLQETGGTNPLNSRINSVRVS